MCHFIISMVLLTSGADPSPEVLAQYTDCSHTFSGGEYENAEFHYRLMTPAKVEDGKRYPLVLFLHGAGERGDDNAKQLLYFPSLMADDEHRQKYPCYLLAPQCRSSKWWSRIRRPPTTSAENAENPTEQMQVVEAVLQQSLAELPIDRKRVYLTGLSMGGFGSWDLACRHPEWFAAVAPICGGGDPEAVRALVDVPVWAFHGGADPVVPPERTRQLIEALTQAGGSPKYTELEGVGHNSWTPAYADPEGLIPWMFRQRNERISGD